MTGASLPRFNELQRTGKTAFSRSSGGVRQSKVREQIVAYLQTLGFAVSSLFELQAAIDGLEDEEELSTYPCQEGLAVHHASDGWWVLFTDDIRLA